MCAHMLSLSKEEQVEVAAHTSYKRSQDKPVPRTSQAVSSNAAQNYPMRPRAGLQAYKAVLAFVLTHLTVDLAQGARERQLWDQG